MAKGIRIGLDEVVCHLSEWKDASAESDLLLRLVRVLVSASMAVLAGARGPTGIADWALRGWRNPGSCAR